MGRVIAFSEFESYLNSFFREEGDLVRATILDTNIMISLTYEIKRDFEMVSDFIDILLEKGFNLFTTVNTKSEFLDFHRRLGLTEHLRDMLDHSSKWHISTAAKAQIEVQSGQLKRNELQGSDPVFTDRQLKKIKSAFSAGTHSGHIGWLKICMGLLSGRLDEAEAALEKYGIHYITQHEPHQKGFFHKNIDWADAKRIAATTGIGLSDAMILNAFQCSQFPFMVSSDFDIGYAVLASKEMKDVVVPDSVAKKYRSYHFE